MMLQPITPVIVRAIEEPTRETTVADVLIDAIGLTGVFFVLAVVAGLLAGGLLIWFKRLRPDNSFNGQAEHTRLGLPPGAL